MSDKEPKDPKDPQETGGLIGRLTQMLGLKPSQANMIKLIAVALALGILFLNAGELFGVTETNPQPANATEVVQQPVASQDELVRLEREIATNLAEKLSLIQGAGQVRVAVTLEASPAIVPVMSTRQQETSQHESAADDSTRKTDTKQLDKTHVVTRDGNRDVLAVLKRDRAPIAGVLIVADGAGDSRVRARLHAAAVTALGAPAHRVSVVASQGR